MTHSSAHRCHSLVFTGAGSAKLVPDSPHESGDRGAGMQIDVVNWISMIFEDKIHDDYCYESLLIIVYLMFWGAEFDY